MKDSKPVNRFLPKDDFLLLFTVGDRRRRWLFSHAFCIRLRISPGPFEEKRLIFLSASPFLRFFGELRGTIDSGEPL
jgi:hypothetical protein